MDRDDARVLARMVMREMEADHNADLAPKWQQGIVIFKPIDPLLKQHELSMDRFMQKVIMMRDNLRVLEQQINSNKSLENGEKIKLQSYITRIYGSMTSFNFMFAEDEDKFKGQGES